MARLRCFHLVMFAFFHLPQRPSMRVHFVVLLDDVVAIVNFRSCWFCFRRKSDDDARNNKDEEDNHLLNTLSNVGVNS